MYSATAAARYPAMEDRDLSGSEALTRLGGGRWASKDGRFTIEPQSGTWVVVDVEQADELGLPLVRGPFPSLTAARDSIAATRDAAPAESPLAERMERAKRAEPAKGKGASGRRPSEPEAPPEPPPEPAWLRKLDDDARRRVRDIVRRLEKAGIDDPDAVARAEVADDDPALARLAIERRLTEAAQEDDAPNAVRAVVDALLDGRDAGLDARWRLVDGAGREIRRLAVEPPKPRSTRRRG
jgi:hypothetical protein